MKVIGLDLSLTSTGVAVVSDRRIRTVTSVKSKGSRKDSLEHRWIRLGSIVSEITQASGEYDWHYANLAVLEAPSYGSKHGSQHDRSGLWWKVVSHFLSMGIPVATVPPKTRAKYITGNGNAGKTEVLQWATKTYGVQFSCDDEADALGLAAMGSRALGEPLEDVLPPRSIEAYEVIEWPV